MRNLILETGVLSEEELKVYQELKEIIEENQEEKNYLSLTEATSRLTTKEKDEEEIRQIIFKFIKLALLEAKIS